MFFKKIYTFAKCGRYWILYEVYIVMISFCFICYILQWQWSMSFRLCNDEISLTQSYFSLLCLIDAKETLIYVKSIYTQQNAYRITDLLCTHKCFYPSVSPKNLLTNKYLNYSFQSRPQLYVLFVCLFFPSKCKPFLCSLEPKHLYLGENYTKNSELKF